MASPSSDSATTTSKPSPSGELGLQRPSDCRDDDEECKVVEANILNSINELSLDMDDIKLYDLNKDKVREWPSVSAMQCHPDAARYSAPMAT